MTDMPHMPEPHWAPGFQGGLPRGAYTADQMRAYAEAAIKQEREAILSAIDDTEEKPWHGYENPNTFQDGKWAAMAAILARSPSTPVQEEPQ